MKTELQDDDEKERQLRGRDKPTTEQVRDASFWEPRIREKMAAAAKEGFTLMMIGRTGVGKSSTVNRLLGKHIAPVGAFEVTTRSVERYPTELFGTKATVIDTPGLCDEIEEKGNDDKYLEEIKEKVSEVDCLFFVTQLNDRRVRRDEKDAIRLITKALGPNIWKHAVIVFTFADAVTECEYSLFLSERSRLIKHEIKGVVGPTIADKIPSVAVTNITDRNPDGEEWLPELYVTTMERMTLNALAPWLAATAPRVIAPDPERGSAESVRSSPSPNEIAQDAPPSDTYIRLNAVQAQRFTDRCGNLGESIGALISPAAAATGRAVGESVGRGIEAVGNAIKKGWRSLFG